MQETDRILGHLQNIFQAILYAVANDAPQTQTTRRNAKGDNVKWFDIAANEAVRRYLEQHFPYPVQLWSEESDTPEYFGSGQPEYTLVLDPVDGSENFARGLSPAGTAIAVIPAELPVSVATVQYAFVGNLFTRDSWWAIRGEGTYYNGQLVSPSPPKTLRDSLVSIDLNRHPLQPEIDALLQQAQGVRSFGAATLSLTQVAMGACALHIDARDRLTPENFLAPALLITETGGMITNLQGQPLPDINSLTERLSILAGSSATLHADVVAWLNKKDV